jgi:hypothetical protein
MTRKHDNVFYQKNGPADLLNAETIAVIAGN